MVAEPLPSLERLSPCFRVRSLPFAFVRELLLRKRTSNRGFGSAHNSNKQTHKIMQGRGAATYRLALGVALRPLGGRALGGRLPRSLLSRELTACICTMSRDTIGVRVCKFQLFNNPSCPPVQPGPVAYGCECRSGMTKNR